MRTPRPVAVCTLIGTAAPSPPDRTDLGRKVPTLRKLDLRADPDFVKAYGHNGYFKTLEGIVHFYNTREMKPACSGSFTEAQALASVAGA